MAATNARPPIEEYEQDQSQQTTELTVSRDTARVVQEVQGAIIVAQRFPRNEDQARIKLLKACKRRGFAEDAEYKFPRGGSQVSGPSVQLAREAARVWGNIQYGFEITAEDEIWRSIRAYAWDVESNSRTFQEDRFKKLIYRKAKGNQPAGWVQPDERDLRELTNRRAAVCYRNCILQLIPSDLVGEAVDESRLTLRDQAAKDPDGERKRICDAFAGDLNVMPATLETILGHGIAEASPTEIADLRAIYKSIRDGNSTISDYLQRSEGADAATAGKSQNGLDAIKARHSSGGTTVAAAPDPQQPAGEILPPPAEQLSPEEQKARNDRRKELEQQTETIKSQRTGKHSVNQQPVSGITGVFGEDK